MARSEFWDARQTFFRAVYSNTEGYVVLATLDRDMENFHEEFFAWPSERDQFLDRIEELNNVNVYYCPQVFSEKKRAKKTVAYTTCAWADLDDCHPDNLELEPSITIQTSPDKYQAIWLFDRLLKPEVAENISRRIAAAHRSHGADHCWNLGRLLRVPYTMNTKYPSASMVTIIKTTEGGRFRPSEFDVFPQVQGTEYMDIPFPEEFPPETAEELLELHKYDISDRARELIQHRPKDGESWSHLLWSLLMLLFEAGLTKEQVYIIAQTAACNKFARDKKPPEYLWADVCRAFIRNKFHMGILHSSNKVEPDPEILTEEEKSLAQEQDTYVERYIKWASGLGDAAPQYHQAGAFVSLSSLLAGSVKLPTSFGTIVPNLWFMILADTTLTRKTTSMDICMDLTAEVDEDVLLATDGSIEGLFTALSTRPGRPSVFLRDEFSGLLDQMNKRDYMAGFAEMLTKLYDGKVQKRQLRRETVEVKDPCVILYTGGIRSKVQEILTDEQIASGFLPRFVFITAESDINRVQPLGPPTDRDWGARDSILDELRTITAGYTDTEKVRIKGKLVNTGKKRVWSAELTPEAWTRYNAIESTMMKAGVRSKKPEVFTPIYDRLSKSILKAAVLLAASRQVGTQKVTVELKDIVHAAYYGMQWRDYAKEVVVNVGHSRDEKRIMTIYNAIVRSAGIARSALMQGYHLSKRDADSVLDTLEQRGLITRTKVGRTEMIKAFSESESEEQEEKQQQWKIPASQ